MDNYDLLVGIFCNYLQYLRVCTAPNVGDWAFCQLHKKRGLAQLLRRYFQINIIPIIYNRNQ